MAWSLFAQDQVTPRGWADAVLSSGGWPDTAANEQSLISWALLEGGGGEYNPLNSTQGDGTSFNSIGVKNYPSWDDGLTQTVATMTNGYYPDIVAALKSGKGIGPAAGSDLQTWSGQGYDALQGTWGEAEKYLDGKKTPLPTGPTSPTSPGGGEGDLFGSIGSSLGTIAGAIGKVETFVDFFLQPNHWVRIGAGVGGAFLMTWGLWSMSRTGRAYSANVPVVGSIPVPEGGQLAPALGIAAVTIGSVGLFLAFHGLPTSVKTLGDLTSYLQAEIQTGGKANAEAQYSS